MPLAFEDDARSTAAAAAAGAQAGGFDLHSASTLYWKPVPVLLRQADREEQQEELTFRIMTGVLRNNHNMRVLRIHITSDSDLFFMHSLEVSEEDFQSLKNEQGILVDFASFPVKIITLLDKCISIQPADTPRFQAVLNVRGGESLFRIVETNDFKQLPHITLAFRPGNDSAIKQFLAFRLLEVKSDADQLATQLSCEQAEHSRSDAELSKVRQQLAAVKEQYDKHVLEVQAESKTQRAHAHEERARERAELKAAHDTELSDVCRKHAEVVEGLQARVAELDVDNRQLRDTKYQLDAKVSELSHRLGTAEGANRSLEDEVSRLRSLHQQLSADKLERDVLVNELKSRLAGLEEKSSSQTELVEQQRARARDLESGLRQAEGRVAELKEALAAAEQRTREVQGEVVKGNNIIDKLTTDLRLVKEKSKRKQAILVRQEEELNARDAAMAAASREAQGLQATIEGLRSEVSKVGHENSELRSKLEDSKQQLQSNEQMIRWLNQQVTEVQLGGAVGGALPGSRYSSYRAALPSSTTPGVGGGSSSLHHLNTPGTALLPAPSQAPGTAHAAVVVSASTPGSALAPKHAHGTGNETGLGAGKVNNGSNGYSLMSTSAVANGQQQPSSTLSTPGFNGLGPRYASAQELATPAVQVGNGVGAARGLAGPDSWATQPGPAPVTAASSRFFAR